MADFAEEKEERGKVVDDLGQNPLMEKTHFWGFAMYDHHHAHMFWLSGW